MAERPKEWKGDLLELIGRIVEYDDEKETADEAAESLAAFKDMYLIDKAPAASASAAASDPPASGESSSAIPKKFLCPITGELMKDPVILETGQTYDRPAIEKWFHKGHDTCPITNKVLLTTTLTPNLVLRELILEWCENNGLEAPKLANVEEVAIPAADESHLNSLLEKLSSPSLLEHKAAAKELRHLTKVDHSFRGHFVIVAESFQRLLRPLDLDHINLHPILQEDLITTVLNISLHEENKSHLVEGPLVLPKLIMSLEYGNIHTRANAAAALFCLSSNDAYKVIIGNSGALKPLVSLLELGHPVAIKDAAEAIYNLCLVVENKSKAVSGGAVEVLMRHIKDGILVEELICILVLLSSNLKAIDEMCKHDTVPCLLRIMRETDSQRLKENCISILFSIISIDQTKVREVREEEAEHRTISSISLRGNVRARKKASGILERLNKSAKRNPTV